MHDSRLSICSWALYEFSGHSAHIYCVMSLRNVPTAQASQCMPGAPAYPATHRHAVTVMEPSGDSAFVLQGKQLSSLMEVASALYVCAAHAVHVMFCETFLKVPGGQDSQENTPATAGVAR